ncbi:hypothetical protein LINPERHAP1_LOCUS3882 [Linum perenne]
MAMDSSYDPADMPPALSPFDNGVVDLFLGTNANAFMFRLAHKWYEPLRGGGASLYTQWIDSLEYCIEGFTDALDESSVFEQLVPGTIYKMVSPNTIKSRQTLQTCQCSLMLLIRMADLRGPVHEDPMRPFFPRYGFNINDIASATRPFPCRLPFTLIFVSRSNAY